MINPSLNKKDFNNDIFPNNLTPILPKKSPFDTKVNNSIISPIIQNNESLKKNLSNNNIQIELSNPITSSNRNLKMLSVQQYNLSHSTKQFFFNNHDNIKQSKNSANKDKSDKILPSFNVTRKSKDNIIEENNKINLYTEKKNCG